jgi:nucleoside-diphosphate-sugar epimerase
MKALVLGATGLIGFHITMALRRRGLRPRALVRDAQRGRVLHGDGVDLVVGDVTDPTSLQGVFNDVDVVFHAAGIPEQWVPDEGVFERVNHQGCRHVAQAAAAAGVRRLVFLSTIDVFEPEHDQRIHEQCARRTQARSAYERSKQAADLHLQTQYPPSGPLEIVYLHPCAIYGPGPTKSRGTNDFVKEIKARQIPILIPGGVPLVLAADVGEAAVRAAEGAQPGERFVLAGPWISLKDLAQQVHQHLGYGRVPPVLPLPVARAVSTLTQAWSHLAGGAPLVPRGQLEALQWGAKPDARRARERLEMTFTSLDTGLRQLLDSLH